MHKSAIVGFSYLFGLIAASFLGLGWIFPVAAATFATALLLYLLKKPLFAAGTAVFTAAMCVYFIYSSVFYEPIVTFAGETVPISGTIAAKTAPSNDVSSLVISAEIGGRTTLLSVFSADINAQIGDNISFNAKLSLPADNAVFAEQAYFKTQEIYLKAASKGDITIEKPLIKPLSYYIAEYRGYIQSKITTALDGDEGAFLAATLLGNTSLLDNAAKNSMRRTGLAHYLAVSGMHLSLVGNLLMVFLNATSLKSRRRLKMALLLCVLAAFMLFYGFSASVLRSGFMLIVFYGADFFRRKANAWDSLGAALLLILIPSPFAAVDTGLLLSVSGTLGIAVVGKKVNIAINKKLTHKHFIKVREAAVSALCAAVCTLPVSLLAFGGISVISPVVNLVFAPFFDIALFCLIVFSILGGFGNILLLIAGAMAKIMLALINFFAASPFAYINLDFAFIPLWLFASIAFVAAVYGISKSTKSAAQSAAVPVIALAAIIMFVNIGNKDSSLVTIYSDGAAGVVFVQQPDLTDILVVGDSKKTAKEIEDFLVYNNIKHVDLLLCPNLTQSGATRLSAVFEKVELTAVIIPNQAKLAAEKYGLFNEAKLFFAEKNPISDVEITANDTRYYLNGRCISLSAVKASGQKPADIAVLTGWSTQALPDYAALTIALNRRQDTEHNAFYRNMNYYIDKDGAVREGRTENGIY